MNTYQPENSVAQKSPLGGLGKMPASLVRPDPEVVKNIPRPLLSEDEGDLFYGSVEEVLPAAVISLSNLPGMLTRLNRTLRRLERPTPENRPSPVTVYDGNSPTRHGTTFDYEVVGQVLASLAADLKRIADKCDPPPPDLVDTEYVAEKLGVTLKRISQMALAGDIPPSCIVPGTGQGKPWKFYRSRIDPWIAAR